MAKTDTDKDTVPTKKKVATSKSAKTASSSKTAKTPAKKAPAAKAKAKPKAAAKAKPVAKAKAAAKPKAAAKAKPAAKAKAAAKPKAKKAAPKDKPEKKTVEKKATTAKKVADKDTVEASAKKTPEAKPKTRRTRAKTGTTKAKAATKSADLMASTTEASEESSTKEIATKQAKPAAKAAANTKQSKIEKTGEESEELTFDAPPVLSESFDDWELAPTLRKALSDMGYDRPMPVQQAVFQALTAGKDLMVQSKTGSGKTSAFGIPISQLLSHEKKGVQALILAPTRELAMQVAKEVSKLVIHMDVSVVPIYGGTPIGPQIEQLAAGAQIVAGTPGRVLDHIRRGTLDTSGIIMFTLDECDEMLSMGFQEEIENIIKTMPSKDKRQTLLFSATIPKEIQRIGRRHMNDPAMISLSSDRVGAELIDHHYYVVTGMARTKDLLKLMKAEKPESAIIFCNTREETNTVARSLRNSGMDAEALSSDLSQSDRERVMQRMRDKNLNYLVATDIAARGIDISELSHVINYTFPSSPEIYVHRTGRTGRAGKQGTALSLVGPKELGSFYYLKLIYKIDPTERELPGTEELGTIQEGERYQEVIGKVEGKARGEYLKLARRLWQSSEGERVVALLLQNLLAPKKDRKQPSITSTPASPEARTDSPSREPRTADVPAREETRQPEGGERKRRRRRGYQGSDESTGDRPAREPRERPLSATSTATTSPPPQETSTPAVEVQQSNSSVETSLSEDNSATQETSEERPRRKRRRRRTEHRDTDAQKSADSVETTEAVEAAPDMPTKSEEQEVSGEESPEAEVTVEVQAATAAEVEEEAVAISEAVIPEVEQAEAESAPADEGQEPRRKRRRRSRRGQEEPESRQEEVSSSDTVAAKSEVQSKRRPRRPRTEPGSHSEFWEAWADTKHTDPPEEGETHVFSPAPAPASETSKSSEDENGERKNRKRKRRRSKRDDEGTLSTPAEDETPNTHPVRLFVNLGKREDANADDIRDFLSEALGESNDGIGKITLRNTHSYVRATEEVADTVIDTCTGLTFRERAVVVERARR